MIVIRILVLLAPILFLLFQFFKYLLVIIKFLLILLALKLAQKKNQPFYILQTELQLMVLTLIHKLIRIFVDLVNQLLIIKIITVFSRRLHY